MPDRETVKKCLEACTGDTADCAGHTCPYWDFDGDISCRTQMELDALVLLKEQEKVEQRDAEMLIIHNGGAEEYVKDIESIVLLAHKDYDIVYCGTFGRSVKWE